MTRLATKIITVMAGGIASPASRKIALVLMVSLSMIYTLLLVIKRGI